MLFNRIQIAKSMKFDRALAPKSFPQNHSWLYKILVMSHWSRIVSEVNEKKH